MGREKQRNTESERERERERERDRLCEKHAAQIVSCELVQACYM